MVFIFKHLNDRHVQNPKIEDQCLRHLSVSDVTTKNMQICFVKAWVAAKIIIVKFTTCKEGDTNPYMLSIPDCIHLEKCHKITTVVL